jgi:hypothetical protein
VLLFSFIRYISGSTSAALVGAVTYTLGTPTWGWASSFFGHAAAGALLIIGFILMHGLHGNSGRHMLGRIALAGAALGAAVTVEFPSAAAVAIIFTYFAIRNLYERDAIPALLTTMAVGAVALLAQIPLFGYNSIAFGSPFMLGYSNVVGFEEMKTGFFGLNLPKWNVVAEILVGFKRGVLWLSPVVFLAFFAAVSSLRRAEYRLMGAMIIALVGFYVMLNSSYAYWTGGWTIGPRHITPVYPFLALALGIWFADAGPRWRATALVVLGISVALSLACVSVTMAVAEEVENPLFEVILPGFIDGNLAQTMVQIVFGTRGLWQLAPLAIIWAVLGTLFWRQVAFSFASNPRTP